MSERICAIDIGSTNVHCGLVDISRGVCLSRSDFPIADLNVRLPVFAGRLKAGAPAVIAGNRPVAVKKTAGILAKKGVRPISRLRWHHGLAGLPIRFNYKNPGALGADRIADALYAAVKYPKRSVIIIDSGTAITVDAVSSAGVFRGGTILAGTGMQLRSLHESTGTLPLLTMPDRRIPLPGDSTAACMRAGAAHGTAGALNHLVRKYKHLLGRKCLVLATGGAWHLTRNLVDFGCIEVPDMTLVGTALFSVY
jgi:pantothenate kinase type III